MLLRLIKTEFIRTKNILPQIIGYCLILITISLTFTNFAASSVYSKESFNKINCAVYFPDDFYNNQFAFEVFSQLESVSQILELTYVTSIEQGHSLVDKGEASFFIIIPENFIGGILTGENHQAKIVIPKETTLEAAAINEFFITDATMLSIAQTSVYIFLELSQSLPLDADEINLVRNKINSTLLTCFLSKNDIFKQTPATTIGDFSLEEYYLGVGISIILFFMSFILIKQLTEHNKPLISKLKQNGIHGFHIFLSRFIVTFAVTYLSLILCFVGLYVFGKSPNISAFITVIPAILVICLIINLVYYFSKSQSIGVFTLLILLILFYYVAGGLLPLDFLPKGIKSISSFSPATYIINSFNLAFWG